MKNVEKSIDKIQKGWYNIFVVGKATNKKGGIFMKDVYVVVVRYKDIKDWTALAVNQECFTSKEKAIEFCEGRMTKAELETRKKQLDRNLINWYEFDTKICEYTIKVLSVK